ncbi:metalloregulator ArsR/SmtB family transcription factor [Ferroplasma sp.]|uniref:ArsR/SmtB family transcription factor n=1 Tax=Ferroplasma sp. TaxID=2591003 RepID=UPI00307D0CBB
MEKIRDINIYKMLSDEIRLEILKLLSTKDASVGEIIGKVNADQPLISHKLKELRENGLVISQRSGRNIIYSLSDKSLNDVLNITESTGNKIDLACNCAECDLEDK